jgi:polysaccharide export outer membrane protein
MSRLTNRVWVGLLLIGALPAVLYAQDPPAQSPVVPTASPGGTEVLRPGDVIRLRIWREPDLSGDFPVDESGVVTLPKLGRIPAVGFSRDSLKEHLVSSYETYLRNPSIEVALLRRISVLGAVRTPNVYAVDPTLTVSEVVAMAGGAAPDGKIDQVQVLRGTERLDVKLREGTRLSETPIRSGDQLYVPQRSWASRNIGFLVGTITGAIGLVYTLTR